MLVRYILSSVCLRLSQFFQSSSMHGSVCTQLMHFFYDDCENMCTISYYHYQIGSMTYLPLFRVRSSNNSMCCMIFCIHIFSGTYIVIMYITPEKYIKVANTVLSHTLLVNINVIQIPDSIILKIVRKAHYYTNGFVLCWNYIEILWVRVTQTCDDFFIFLQVSNWLLLEVKMRIHGDNWLPLWWHHDIDMFLTSLALCVGNPLVNSAFPSQRDQ